MMMIIIDTDSCVSEQMGLTLLCEIFQRVEEALYVILSRILEFTGTFRIEYTRRYEKKYHGCAVHSDLMFSGRLLFFLFRPLRVHTDEPCHPLTCYLTP